MMSVTGNISASLQGIQHVGVTVNDLKQSYEFYVDLLGGTPILAGSGFAGDAIHNTLLQKEELGAQQAGLAEPKIIGVPNLREGRQVLDVQFVQFDNVVVELLHYHDAEHQSSEHAFAPQREQTSPAIPTSMHISFYLKDDVNVGQFVKNLEQEAHQRGMSKVTFNAIVRVNSEGERQELPAESFVNKIEGDAVGDFDGWTLAYGKGPSGEQLEFNQVTKRAKALFERVKHQRQ